MNDPKNGNASEVKVEPKPEYIVNTNGCPSCGNFNQIKNLEGMDVQIIGQIAFTTLHGVCLKCKREIHFSSRDRILAHLVEHILAARNIQY